MNACPTSAPITSSSNQYDRDAASSRSSFSISHRQVALGAARRSGERKKHLFEIGARANLLSPRSSSSVPSPTTRPPLNSTNRSQMRAASPSWWIERNSVRPSCRARPQHLHDVACLPEIETVERLVEHQQRLPA